MMKFTRLLFATLLICATAQAKDAKVTLNFQNADIETVVKMMSQVTGRNFLIDPRVKGTVSVISSTPVTHAEAYQIMLSALRSQGFTAVEGRGVVKVLPESDAKLMAMPTFEGKIKDIKGDQLVTQVYALKHESAAQLVPILRPLIAPNNQIAAYNNRNALVITDYADNIRRLERIIGAIDQPGDNSDVHIIRLEHASALDMAALLNRLLADNLAATAQPNNPAGAGDSNARFSIIPDLRTNSLLVRSDNTERLERIRKLLSSLDVPASGAGNIHVVYLKNAEATKLADLLRGLVSGETRSSSAGTTANAAPSAKLNSPDAVMVQADEATNALIITAPDGTYNALRGVIEKLDLRRAQVYIEALIAEVTSAKAAEFGVQWQMLGNNINSSGGYGGTNFSGTNSSIVGLSGNPTAVGEGLSVGYIRGTTTLPNGLKILNIAALARALESDANGNILSAPNLMTLDNSEAKIVVGQNVPFVTGSFTQTGGSNSSAVNPFQTIERKDVGLTLKIKPQVSEGGAVKLEIYQEVSSLEASTGGARDVVTKKRSIESKVLVDDGSILVLGGLMDDKVQDNQQGVPWLSKIPVLGALFRYNSRTHTKTNLMIFIKPTVLRDATASSTLTGDRYENMRSKQQNMPLSDSIMLPQVDRPTLPALPNK